MEFSSIGPALGRLGSDSCRGAKSKQGAEPPYSALTLTTGHDCRSFSGALTLYGIVSCIFPSIEEKKINYI